MTPQRLLFSIGPPALSSFIYWEKVFCIQQTYQNTSDSKTGGHPGILSFWMTHNANFRANMMPKLLLFSIGPPALPSLLCWEKEAFLYPVNISEHQRQQSRRPYRKKQFLRHHIFSKIRVVGHPKNDKFRGVRLLFCRWCSDMFAGYKKDFFSKHMNDSKAGGPIEKSNL